MAAAASEPAHAANVMMRSGFLPDRIIHLHPTRLCNLACLHCYSESGLREKAALDPVVLGDALALLRAEGYQVISLSGGEPLVYKPLRNVVERARDLGYRITMVTNGLLATARMDATLELLDGMAVSFDGLATTHDHIRGRVGAFAQASAAVARLAAQGRPVAAAISLTRDALPELPELADHLVALGARALQIRPVAMAGRARTMAGFASYTATDLARLYLVALALREELADQAKVHCDLAPAQGLWQQGEAYTGLLGSCDVLPYHHRPLADLVNPLVITDTGALKPIAYDFHDRFTIAHIDGLTTDGIMHYKQHGLAAYQALIGNALAGLQPRTDLVDWFDHCTRTSEQVALGRATA
ncbi:MAG: radical SAM protein [Flavobacteriales bacterium]